MVIYDNLWQVYDSSWKIKQNDKTTSYPQKYITVPCLYDTKTCQIVNNESAEIIEILNKEFNAFIKDKDKKELDLSPQNKHIQDILNLIKILIARLFQPNGNYNIYMIYVKTFAYVDSTPYTTSIYNFTFDKQVAWSLNTLHTIK